MSQVQDNGAAQPLENPLKNLSKKQVGELARVVAQSNGALSTLQASDVAIRDARFVIQQAMSSEKTAGAVQQIKALERDRDRATVEQRKVGELLDRRPDLRERFEQYQAVVKAAAGGELTAKALLADIQTDLTIASTPTARAAGRGGHFEAAEGGDQEENGIAPGRSVEKWTVAKGSGAEKGNGKSEVVEKHSERAASAVGEARKRRVPNEFIEAAALVLYPPALLARYMVRGNDVLDKRTERVAFVDKGDKLKAGPSADRESILAMLDTAEARGWDTIKVFGTQAFRAAAWMEAASRGMAVEGYKPSPSEEAAAMANRQINGKDNVIAAETKGGELLRSAFLSATTTEQRTKAAKENPVLAKAFALETAYTKAMTTVFGKDKATASELVSSFRETIASKLEAEEPLPGVEVRDRSAERGREHNVSDQERG